MAIWGASAASALGQSKNEAIGAAATFGNLFVAMGLTDGKAAGMSKQMVELSADLASFNNTTTEDAITAIGAALRGESEPIRRYGVLLNEATLKAKAFEMGLSDGKAVLDPVTKALASYQVILEQTTVAQGDFARTSEGLANSMKMANAQFEDAKASIGEMLLPAVAAASGWIAEALASFNELGFSGFDLGPIEVATKGVGLEAYKMRQAWKEAADAAEAANLAMNENTLGIEENGKAMAEAANELAKVVAAYESLQNKSADLKFEDLSPEMKLHELGKREAEIRDEFNYAIKVNFPDATPDELAKEILAVFSEGDAESMAIVNKLKELEIMRDEIIKGLMEDEKEKPEEEKKTPAGEIGESLANDYQRRGLSLDASGSGNLANRTNKAVESILSLLIKNFRVTREPVF
jgi:hypothetical protein